MSNKVLVTGSAGFIGSHFCERLLTEGREVVGLDNYCDFYSPEAKRRNVAALGCTQIEIDIRDSAAIDALVAEHRPESIIHLAAMAGVRPSIENPALYAEVNVGGTVNLLDAAVRHGVRRFVFASSSSVYGNNRKVPFAEDDRVDHPISPYAATKKAGELICHSYAHLHGLPIACLRFFTVYGPRQRPDLAIAKFMRLIAAGKPIPVFGDGATSRDYTYIDDIVDGISAAWEKNQAFRIYNLGGNRPVSLADLIAMIERTVGRPAVIDRQPMQPGDVERTFADLTRSEAELGYIPQVTMETGLARQWQWAGQQQG